jgi:hypothetical protein
VSDLLSSMDRITTTLEPPASSKLDDAPFRFLPLE